MQMPASLLTLAEYGLVEEVIRPLMSGKEAQIYLVVSQGEERVAKVYREAEHRNFKHRVEYTEGRKTRNSRDQRAMGKRSRYGRSQDEAAWRAAEVDMIYRLSDAGVPVPKPYHFVDGVLIMEMVKDADGEPAPRLGDLDLTPDEATEIYEKLLREVVRMLAAGVVHGDLSDFNVLMGTDGPVIIDFPQSVDASANTGARKLLIRDVDNLHNFAKRCMVSVRTRPYAQEMWELYQRGELTADTQLLGKFKGATAKVNTESVLGLVREAESDEHTRRKRQGGRGNSDSTRLEGVVPEASFDEGEQGAESEAVTATPSSTIPRRREVVMVSPTTSSVKKPAAARGGQRRGQQGAQSQNRSRSRDDRQSGEQQQRRRNPAPTQQPREATPGNRGDGRAADSADRTGELTDGQRRRRNRRPRQQNGQSPQPPPGEQRTRQQNGPPPAQSQGPPRPSQRTQSPQRAVGNLRGEQNRPNSGRSQDLNPDSGQSDSAANRGRARRRRRPRRPGVDGNGSSGPGQSEGQ